LLCFALRPFSILRFKKKYFYWHFSGDQEREQHDDLPMSPGDGENVLLNDGGERQSDNEDEDILPGRDRASDAGHTSDSEQESDGSNSVVSATSAESDENDLLVDSDEAESDDSADDDENMGGDDEHLYPNSVVTVGEALLAILAFFMRHKLTGQCLGDLLPLIALLCPPGNQCIKTLHKFKRVFFHDR